MTHELIYLILFCMKYVVSMKVSVDKYVLNVYDTWINQFVDLFLNVVILLIFRIRFYCSSSG